MVEVSLIEQLQRGDIKAFEKLVESTRQRGLNIAYGILQDPQDAEEILQEAYLQVYHHIGQLKAPETFRSWFGKIVTHLALRRAKEKGRFKTIPLEDLPAAGCSITEGPEYFLLKKEKQVHVAQTLKTLPDEYRAALILREWEDYSYQEISEVLDIPLGTVKSRIYCARKLLSKKLIEGGC
ncbi:hypothetical protein P378_09490 [Desulforamulus profundi]|uniref:RNA polymerase sigma factor n=2 Tax=Desulforamulus TaxID=2916693 RepID=A0A2C6MGG9_9FIRM|nr:MULTISPECIES: RNA polymerase sigma factor [Desulforamulus]PHJ38496.1 hypothetical protein P378_09490 [Desulforamulus profundi]SHE30849.1 RNA polymerase sigma-70 factor, ECF subfamily [Desulforamulus putei DSM 12395]